MVQQRPSNRCDDRGESRPAGTRFTNGTPVALTAISENEFFVDGGDHTRLAFRRDPADKPARLVLNPGPWQISGERIN